MNPPVFFLRSFILLSTLCCLQAGNASAQNRELAWSELTQGRAVAIIRHATAPGLGDPPGFQIGDCSTQRNLSEEGRIQARRIGSFFKHKGIKEATVYSSQWCRCLETARLLDLGPVKELQALNSFFQDPSAEEKQTKEILSFITSLPSGKATILVTHQVNITALTGIFPSSGEVIIFQPRKNGQGKVIGRFTL
jgi:phosphohistidine phosphatase SixA